MAALTAARVGDRVIFERADALFDVENVTAPGVIEKAPRSPLKTFDEAVEIAAGHKKDGARLWVRHHANPNSVEPYRAGLDVSKMPTTGRTAPPAFGKTSK